MKWNVLIAVLLALLFSVPAFPWTHGLFTGSATIHNYNSVGNLQASQISHHDTNGNQLDAHGGNLLQVANTFYFYGHSDGCGVFISHSGTPWCGVRVYSTTDFNVWVDHGYLFDPAAWQTKCAVGTVLDGSCFDPKMMFNPTTGKYVLWLMYQASPVIEYVFVCDTPTGGASVGVPGTNCIQQPNVNLTSGVGSLTPSFLVSGNNGYIVSSDNSYSVNIQALNSSFTDVTGSVTVTGGTGEAIGVFQRGGNTYIIYGEMGCTYCTQAPIFFMKASSPLGTYSTPVNITLDNRVYACQGQMKDVAVVTASGFTTYLIGLDQWQGGVGSPNQGLANTYYGNLTFSGSDIDAVQCQNASVQGVPPAAAPTPPGVPPATDQTDVGDVFTATCDIAGMTQRLQVFVPATSMVNSVSLPLGINNLSCRIADVCSPPVDGVLTVSLVTVDGSNNPVTTLATHTFTTSDLPWAQVWTNIAFAQSVTPGSHYGIKLSSTSTVGCYGTAISQVGSSPQPYAAGVERVSTNGGSIWTTESGSSFMFSTY